MCPSALLPLPLISDVERGPLWRGSSGACAIQGNHRSSSYTLALLEDKHTMTGMEQDMEKGVHGQEGLMLRLTHQTVDCHGPHFPNVTVISAVRQASC